MYQLMLTGQVPPHTQGTSQPAALIKANGLRWLSNRCGDQIATQQAATRLARGRVAAPAIHH